jgi:hypothetical protein
VLGGADNHDVDDSGCPHWLDRAYVTAAMQPHARRHVVDIVPQGETLQDRDHEKEPGKGFLISILLPSYSLGLLPIHLEIPTRRQTSLAHALGRLGRC